MSPLPRLLPLLPLAVLTACGPTHSASESDFDDCSRYGVMLSPAPASARHLASCLGPASGDGLNPPTSGDHCAETLSCRVYDQEPNRCQWLHNLEHGHVVFLYNCPDDCPDVVASLEALRQEARVGDNGVIRALVAPDSRIPTRVAALLWRRSWGADAVDLDALRCLMRLQDVDAPEAGLICLP